MQQGKLCSSKQDKYLINNAIGFGLQISGTNHKSETEQKQRISYHHDILKTMQKCRNYIVRSSSQQQKEYTAD